MVDAIQVDYDTPWREALTKYFEPFLELFFPEVHNDIDWSRSSEFVDENLQGIWRDDDEMVKRMVNKLFKVLLLDDREVWLLIHIGLDSQYPSNFAEEVSRYNFRILATFNQSAVSLVILGDDRKDWRPSEYSRSNPFMENAFTFSFPLVKLSDYEQDWESLKESKNIFAILIAAYLDTKATTDNLEERKRLKLRIVLAVLQGKFSENHVADLCRWVDSMMVLPKKLQSEFKKELSSMEETKSFVS